MKIIQHWICVRIVVDAHSMHTTGLILVCAEASELIYENYTNAAGLRECWYG